MKEATGGRVDPKATSGIVADATVREALPGALFKVELTTGQEVTAHLSAELRTTLVRLVPGDRVRLEISSYNWSRGRIIQRAR